jgi:hypothetical protein
MLFFSDKVLQDEVRRMGEQKKVKGGDIGPPASPHVILLPAVGLVSVGQEELIPIRHAVTGLRP